MLKIESDCENTCHPTVYRSGGCDNGYSLGTLERDLLHGEDDTHKLTMNGFLRLAERMDDKFDRTNDKIAACCEKTQMAFCALNQKLDGAEIKRLQDELIILKAGK